MKCPFRIGYGYDVHQLVEGRDFWLGGIHIDYKYGLLGHSDADVLLHAICDAILGAASLRDIGYHFPDTSKETENIDSKIILRKTVDLLEKANYSIANIDATIEAQKPKLAQYIPQMITTIARICNVQDNQISIKATTTERLGFVGREEGISASAVALIYSDNQL